MSLRIYDKLVMTGAIPRLDGSREKLMGKDLLMYDVVTPKQKPAKSINQSMWEELDRLVDIVMLSDTNKESDAAREQARGLAFALSLTMKPLFVTPDEISKESGRRFKARRKGQAYQTPCVGERWKDNPVTMREIHVLGKKPEEVEPQPPHPADQTRTVPPAVKTSHKAPDRNASKTPLGKLDQAQRMAIQESTMTDEQLSQLFNVSVAVIGMIRKMPKVSGD